MDAPPQFDFAGFESPVDNEQQTAKESPQNTDQNQQHDESDSDNGKYGSSIVERLQTPKEETEQEQQQQEPEQAEQKEETPSSSTSHNHVDPSKETVHDHDEDEKECQEKRQQSVENANCTAEKTDDKTTKAKTTTTTKTADISQLPPPNIERHQRVTSYLHSARNNIAPLADALNKAISEYNLLEAEFNASATIQDQLREAITQSDQSRQAYQELSENLKWDLDVATKQLEVAKKDEETSRKEIENVTKKLEGASHENSVLGESIRAVRELEKELRAKLGQTKEELTDKTESLEEEQSKAAILEEDKAVLLEWVEAAKMMMSDMANSFSYGDEGELTVEKINRREKERRKIEKRFEKASFGLSFIFNRSAQIEKMKKEQQKQQDQNQSKNTTNSSASSTKNKSSSSPTANATSSSSNSNFGKGIYRFFSGLFSSSSSSGSSPSSSKQSSSPANKTSTNNRNLVGHAVVIDGDDEEEETMADSTSKSVRPTTNKNNNKNKNASSSSTVAKQQNATTSSKKKKDTNNESRWTWKWFWRTKKVQKTIINDKGEQETVEVDEEYEEEEQVEDEEEFESDDDADDEMAALRKQREKMLRRKNRGIDDDDDDDSSDDDFSEYDEKEDDPSSSALSNNKKRNLADEIREKLIDAQEKSREANQKVIFLTKQNAEQKEKIQKLQTEKENFGMTSEYYGAQIADLQNRVMTALARLRTFASERDQAREEAAETLEKLRMSEELNQQLQETLNVRNAQLLKARKQLKLIQSAIDDDNSD